MSARLASLSLKAGLSAIAMLGGLATGLSASAAATGAQASQDPSVAQASQVSELCRTVIGVKPGFTLYSNCVQSLANSAARMNRPEAGPAAARIETAAPAEAAKSYFYASAGEIRRREQSACARLGYDAASGGFAACVASLDAALYAADHRQP